MAFYSCLVIWDSHSPYSPAFVFMAGDYKLYGRWQKNEWISLKYHFNHTNNEWLFKVWIWCALLINMNVITIKRLKVELQIPSEDFVYYYYLAISCCTCRSLVMILKIYLIVCWQEDLTSYLLVYLNCLEVSYIKCYTLVHVDQYT